MTSGSGSQNSLNTFYFMRSSKEIKTGPTVFILEVFYGPMDFLTIFNANPTINIYPNDSVSEVTVTVVLSSQ